MAGVLETLQHPTNRSTVMKLLFYTLLMVTLPLGTYFFLLYVVFKGDMNMVGWSGIGAVFTCNIVIAAYVVSAWKEGGDDVGDIEYVYVDDGTEADIPLLGSEQLRKRVPAGGAVGDDMKDSSGSNMCNMSHTGRVEVTTDKGK